MLFRKICSIVISSMLLLSQTLYATAITVDPNGGINKPTLENAQNGVPVINIVSPNSNGISHNKFQTYNVEKKGLILNNSTAISNTSLAGYIIPNPNLSSNTKVILNEITGTSKSLLQGYTEVAGNTADVIIANPNGIVINGGGFINTPKVTLSTGKPYFTGNTLDGFKIRGGNIFIDGDGFNATNIDKLNLYAKAIELNGKLYAKDLHLVTGDNDITFDNKVTPLEIKGSGISIDSSLLGGIYADTIILASNDKGVGVNLPPEIIAQKDLTINSQGDIVLQNSFVNEDINITAVDGDILSTSEVCAKNINLDSNKNLTIEASSIIEANNNLMLKSNNINNLGEIRTISDNSNLKLEGNQEILNKGAIYSANNINIKADTLINEEMIRSNDEINLLIENSLSNEKNGVIYANGDLNIKANENQDKINTITNYGLIQSHGDINITAKTLENSANTPTYTTKTTSNTIKQGGGNDYDIITTNVTTETLTIPTDPALILADGNVNIDVETLNNSYSLISAGKNITLDAQNANNVGKIALTTTEVITKKYRNERYCASSVCGTCVNHKERAGYRGTFTKTSTTRNPVVNYGIQAKNSISGNVVTLNNLNTTQIVLNEKEGIYQTSTSTSLQAINNQIFEKNGKNIVSKLTLPKNKFGLFILSKNPNHKYLIETNPKYTSYESFIGSDYMLKKLGYDSNNTLKRLGDGNYETTLVRNSIIKLSGQRYLAGYDSDSNQFKALMDNAIAVKSDLNLSLGITLTKEQIKNLTKDIIWMEEKTIEGNKVLVPVVYLVSLDENNFKDGSQILASEDIDLVSTQTFTNQGKLKAKNNLTLLSDKVLNQGGTLKAGNNLTINSNTAIENSSGNMQAENNLELTTDNLNINRATTKKIYTHEQGYQTVTNKGKSSNIIAKNITLNANKDINITGSNIKADKEVALLSNNGDIIVGSTEQKEDFYFNVYGGYYKGNSTKNTGSTIEGENINLLTSGNLNLEGGTIKAKNDLTSFANDIVISSKIDTSSSQYKSETKGFFSSSTTKENRSGSKNIASLLQGKNINITTSSMNLIASKVKANQAEITADIINLISSKDTEYHNKTSDKSDFITRTINNNGEIKEILKEAKIEVGDSLIINGKDISDKLSKENIIKTLSSQDSLDHKQINLVKTTLNNKQWNETTKTLSTMGSLLIQALTTYFTAGSTNAIVAASSEATKQAISTSVHSMITQTINSIANSAISGNDLKLDMKNIAKTSVMAGVMSYANNLAYDQFNLTVNKNLTTSELATKTLIDSSTKTAIYGGDFVDNLKLNSANTIQGKLSNSIGDNYAKGDLDYTTHKLSHAVTAAATAELINKDGASGAIGALTAEVIGESTINELSTDGLTQNEKKTVKLSSEVGAILSAGLINKDIQVAANSGKIAVDNNTIYTYKDKVVATDRINDNKIVVLTKEDKNKMKDTEIYEYQIDDDNFFKNTVNIVSESTINNLSDESKIYNLNNTDDFKSLQKTTDMNYKNINKDTTIVFQNGMGNTFQDALDSENMIKDKYPNENIGLINNTKGKFSYLSDFIEWAPDDLTTKDILNAYMYRQLSPNTVIITHSAGNEDNYKADKINELLGAKTPYINKSYGSPRSSTSLKQADSMVGATFDSQTNHPNDPIANGFINKDANYIFNFKEPFKHSFKTYFLNNKKVSGVNNE